MNSSKYVATRRKTNILGTEAIMENAAGAAWTPDRSAVIDLSEVTYGGKVYLGIYMGDFNGVTIYSITFS
ncbi:MAG: hypothetical protein J5950_09085 [Clostridia bacterium]|nr:hypothetical protein [Clostridia bacterium]